jgi:flagellin-like protein
MTRKAIVGVIGAVLLVAIALFAAEKAKEKKVAEKPEQEAKAIGRPEQKEGLLDQLVAAYKANDREKMGEIINKMESRRDEMRKLAKLNKWHQQAHRQWGMMGWNQQQGRGMGGCQCCCCRGGMGGWGNQMPMGNCGPPPGGFRPMREGGPGPGPQHNAPPACDMSPGNDPSPEADW